MRTRSVVTAGVAVAVLLMAGVAAAAVRRGDGQDSSQQQSAQVPVRAQPSMAPTTIPDCTSIKTLVAALQQLDSKLSVGITYDEYRVANQNVQVAYDAISFHELAPACLDAGVPAEKALNLYRQALSQWKACLDDFQRCPVNSSKAERQRLWSEASDSLAEAKRGLPRATSL